MAQTSIIFINLDPDKTDERIQDALADVGSIMGVDRAYVFLYSEDYTTCSNIFEWCDDGITSQIDHLQDVPSSALPWWTKQMMDWRHIVIANTADMPPEAAAEQELLEAQDIQSLLVVPLSWGGHIEGFIGVDAVRTRKVWQKNDILPLELLAAIILNGRKRAEAELELRSINATLEQRVEERTHDLHEAQSQLFLQDKMASVGQLASGLAHEINNPVSFLATNFTSLEEEVKSFSIILRAYKALLSDPLVHSRVHEQYKAIEQLEQEHALDFVLDDLENLFNESHEGFRRITDIVNSMRNFARRDTVDSFEPYNLNDGIKSTLIIARNAYKYNAQIVKKLTDIPYAECVIGQIHQVLLNLVVNAAQALEEHPPADGNGRIEIRTGQDGDQVFCEIEDNGPGIPADISERIFDPFFTTKPPGSGTGLGLSISYDIVVRIHAGRLTLRPGVSGGACFRMQLPIVQSAAVPLKGEQL